MLRAARREIVSLLRDGRFRLASLLVTVLLGVAMFSGWLDSKAESAAQRRSSAFFREEWEGQTEKNPHSAAHFGTFILKPARSLAGIEPGLDPYVGRLVFLEPRVRNDFAHRPATESSPLRQFGFFTAFFILQVAAPLLIVLFGYAVFAGEREIGTLRQALAAGAKTSTIVGGKMLECSEGSFCCSVPRPSPAPR